MAWFLSAASDGAPSAAAHPVTAAAAHNSLAVLLLDLDRFQGKIGLAFDIDGDDDANIPGEPLGPNPALTL